MDLPRKGFVHKDERASHTADLVDKSELDAPLPSLEMRTLVPATPEVAHIFHLPFTEIANPSRLRMHQFRGGTPYWAVDVSDRAGETAEWTRETPVDEVGGGSLEGGRCD